MVGDQHIPNDREETVMSDTKDLKELVQKAIAGDRRAFEKLYQATFRSVYFTCLGILKEEQDTQEVTQDVYLTAFEQLGTLEDADKFMPWLYRIAANRSIKRLKKKKPILPGDEKLLDMSGRFLALTGKNRRTFYQ